MTDPLVTFPRCLRTPTAAVVGQARGIRPSQAVVVIRSRPTTRSISGSLPTQRTVQIQPQADQALANPIVSPTRVHPSRSYSAVLTSPPLISPVASPAASPTRNSPPTTSRVPALITHFEGRRIIPSPVRSATSSEALLAPSPSSPTSPVIRVSTMMMQAKMFKLIADRLGASSQPRNDDGQAGPSTTANPNTIPPSPIIRPSPAPEIPPMIREPLLEEPGITARGTRNTILQHPARNDFQRGEAESWEQLESGFYPELVPEIEKDVDKLKANFIREVKYPSWIANIVPMKKKNGQIQVCVDFRDLNKACPKDDFPLPITELMVDATTVHEVLSFIDGSFGYNQIRMDPKDKEMMAFRTPKGILCYKVMSFGLKNIGATYQRAMQRIFDDFLHKFVECYVDDLVVKTKTRDDHLKDLRAVFERLRRHQLRMNPLKCAFRVSFEKFLRFIVRHRGIEMDQTKIDVIQQMHELKNLSELKSLQGHLAYIRRFISNLAGRCQPFSRLMKKDTPFEWDESCRRAFQNIKDYLMKSPVLMAPASGNPLLLYIAAQEKSLGALLAQNDDQGKERALYYLSRTMVGAELNYSPIEKTCLALIFVVQKLRHYLFAHSMNLISRANPLKYIMSKPMLSERLAKWALFLFEFEVSFIPQKAIKGQGLANFLADHPISAKWEVSENLPDEEIFYIEVLPPWRKYFDDAARKNGAGANILFMSPNDDLTSYSFILSHCCTNNEAEYQVVILGLGMTIEMGLNQLEIFGDLALMIKQLIGDFEVRKDELVPYHKEVQRLLGKISNVTLGHVPRANNSQADALA
ncbi:hypothetical protein H6P81_018470 [Aristolochia fimbriata]|uniref:Uncharacterized protein n=1 Tax=Aristolochia fimbriata TaxID=158543 RepID=A0AAV7E463_ARIFI|nr:hypothetical protein H6P81_018470 [Aristolochia fimbriata]